MNAFRCASFVMATTHYGLALLLLLSATGCMPRNGSGKPIPPKESPATTSNAPAEEIPNWAGKRTDEPFDVKAFLESRAAPDDDAAPLYVEALSPMCRYLPGEEDSP